MSLILIVEVIYLLSNQLSESSPLSGSFKRSSFVESGGCVCFMGDFLVDYFYSLAYEFCESSALVGDLTDLILSPLVGLRTLDFGVGLGVSFPLDLSSLFFYSLIFIFYC